MPPMQTTRFTGKKILVIDDEWRLAESLAALLRGAGYQVRACSSGREGFEALSSETYDLVITDLRMDGVDGFDIMRHLAEHCPSTGIIVITGHASTESAIEALHQRVADYIPKPFDFEFLRASIEKVFVQQESEQLRRDLVRMLSHDIKVPLTGILGFAQLMISTETNDNRTPREYAARIISNCQRVIAMLDNYLTNAREEEGRLETHLMPVAPVELAEEGLGLLHWEFDRKGIEIRRRYPREELTIQADEPLLSRAVGNLLSNAAKYTPGNGWAEVAVEHRPPGEVVITVSNSGAPMEEQEVLHLFERYQRGGTSRGIAGTGLGLHVVRLVAEAHSGRVGCELAEDGVIRFFIALPVAGTAEP